MAIVWEPRPFLIRLGGGTASAVGADGEHTVQSEGLRWPPGPPHSLGQDACVPLVDAPRHSRRHRPVVRETNESCLVSLLYDVSSPGAGTERSHTAGCRYTVLISCMRPWWQTGHTAPGSPVAP